MSKRKKLKPLRGGLAAAPDPPAPLTPVVEQLEPVAIDHDGQAKPVNELTAQTYETAADVCEALAAAIEAKLPPEEPARPEVMNAERTIAAASDKLDEITVRVMADMFEWYGMDIAHDPDFPYAKTLTEKGGDPSFANAHALSLARSMHLDRRRAGIEQQLAINRDGTTAMYCVQIGHPELDPALNPNFLGLLHPVKHAQAVKDFPALGPEARTPKVESTVAAKPKVTKQPAEPSPAKPKPTKARVPMKVKRSLLNAMFTAMGFNTAEEWSASSMMKKVQTLPKITTEKELAKVKKADKELLSLLKSLINMIEEDRAEEIVITTDSKTATKAASGKPVKTSKRARDEDEDDDEEEESEDDDGDDESDEDEDEESDDESDDDDADEEESDEDDDAGDDEESDDEDEEDVEEDEDEEERPRKGSKQSPATKSKKGKAEMKASSKKDNKKAKPAKAGRAASSDLGLKPGKMLTRTYQGKDHKVKFLGDEGFEYKNSKYTSLTAVAKKITGYASINGRSFFGV